MVFQRKLSEASSISLRAGEFMSTEKMIWAVNTEKTDTPGLYRDYTVTNIAFVNGYEGKPQATEQFTVEQLEQRRIVGIYRIDGGLELGIVDCHPTSTTAHLADAVVEVVKRLPPQQLAAVLSFARLLAFGSTEQLNPAQANVAGSDKGGDDSGKRPAFMGPGGSFKGPGGL
jgi:hypothetical protein